MTAWWQRGVVYQVYPRSFQDSNGDGVGDLPGVMSRLDYLSWLGVDAVWLSPIYPSPMTDFGYDVADFTNVDALFGSLKDFDQLVTKAHELGLKLILDFVPNHSSDQHPWFVESRSSRSNGKRDWYIWRDAKSDGSPPNNWQSEFGGSAWTWDATTQQYYYHAYLVSQPDLNWRHPGVRAAMHSAMRFWLDRGVDGFRLDTIEHLLEDENLRDNPPNARYVPGMPPTQALERRYTTDHPEICNALHGMRAITDAYSERVLIGETYLPLERVVNYYSYGIHLPYNFQLITAAWNAKYIADLIRKYEALLPPEAWPNWVLGNHDRPRIASRVGPEQARVAAMLLLTLRGTPTIYNGDELGLGDVSIPAHMVQDPWEKNTPGHGLGRDPVRTPMAWDTSLHAGFTTGIPWLPLHNDAELRNVATQRDDKMSMLSLYHHLLMLRRRAPALAIGAYGSVENICNVLLYDRRSGDQAFTIALNMDGQACSVPNSAPGSVVLSTYLDRNDWLSEGAINLRAHEGVIIARV